MPISFQIPALIKIDSIYLTDESRQPMSIALDDRSITKTLASGKIKKYYINSARTFTLSWENVPGTMDQTVDGAGGRYEIKEIAFAGTTHTLDITYQNGVVRTYTVFVDSYTEELTTRRAGQTRYSISMDLKEQG